MIVSLHVTHSTMGADTVAKMIPDLYSEAEGFVSGRPEVREFIVIRTCNRFEIYAATDDDEETKRAFSTYCENHTPYSRSDGLWCVLDNKSSVKHLFRVVCGLDSLVIGEDQIQGQVKDAYIAAKEKGTAGKMLTKLFDKALYTGKRVRTETELNSGAVSVGYASVEFARSRLGTLDGKTIAVIGAGDMATTIAKNLAGSDPMTVFVSSRTFDHAKVLANTLGGTAVGFDRLPEVLAISDVAIVATGAPHILVTKDLISDAMEDHKGKLLLIDISVPRNVADDVSEVPNVELGTLGSLEDVARKNLIKRREEMIGAERIILQELAEIEADYKEAEADRTIGALARRLSEIRSEELTIAKSRLNGSNAEEVMDDLSRALIARIMAEPYTFLKNSSRNGCSDYCGMAVRLFGVEKR